MLLLWLGMALLWYIKDIKKRKKEAVAAVVNVLRGAAAVAITKNNKKTEDKV